MKMFFAILLIALLNTIAGENVTLRFEEKVTEEQAISDTADIFVKEIQTFMEKPLEWCTVEPTGKFDLYNTKDDKIVELAVTTKMTCDETMPQKYFESIALRYQPFLLEHGRVVREKIMKKYPDLIFGALMMNHTYAVMLAYNHLYGGDAIKPHFNKIKFVKMVINDEYASPILKKFQVRGYLIGTDDVSGYFTETQTFRFRLYKKTIKNGNIKVRFEPVYHPSAEEGNAAEKE